MVEQVFRTSDNRIFTDENFLNKNQLYNKYLDTYAGKHLLKEHFLTEEGVWSIYGEDPNCDYSGYHSQPYLKTVQGTLKNVILHAVILPNFWTWGAGGEISKIEIGKV